MASSSKEKAFWSSEDVDIFCKLCVEQIEQGIRPGNRKEGWTFIIKKFEELRGKKYNKGQMKSKWDNLKEEWKRWKALLLKEAGLGWDPKKNTIDASDEWWEKKIQENPKFRTFRMKGINSELEFLLDKMFGDRIATGSVTGNPAQELCVDIDVLATQLDIDDCEVSTDNIRCDICEKTGEQGQSHKRSSQSSVRQFEGKKQKMSEAAKTMSQLDRIASAIENRCQANDLFIPYDEVMDTLNVIPEIVQDEPLYYFALKYFADKKVYRQILMKLHGNEAKVRWIKYEFAMHNHHKDVI